MVGIILAAGSGRRLKIQKPKGMLIAGNKPLIQYSIDCLRAAGIQHIFIVTGFKSEFYENYYKNVKDITLIHNFEYENSGSLLSLQLVLNHISDDVVILDSDIIYNYDEFKDFIQNQPKDAIIATNVTNNRSDVCYIDADLSEYLIKISKNINYIKNRDNPWEYIGITKTSKESIPKIQNYIKNTFEKTGSVDHEYDYAFESIDNLYKVCKYYDYLWSEADDNQQLHYLITQIYPKLNLFYENNS